MRDPAPGLRRFFRFERTGCCDLRRPSDRGGDADGRMRGYLWSRLCLPVLPRFL